MRKRLTNIKEFLKRTLSRVRLPRNSVTVVKVTTEETKDSVTVEVDGITVEKQDQSVKKSVN